jgi:hypothetical protein
VAVVAARRGVPKSRENLRTGIGAGAVFGLPRKVERGAGVCTARARVCRFDALFNVGFEIRAITEFSNESMLKLACAT